MDCRQSTRVTIRYKYPLPWIDDLLRICSVHQFSLRSVYHQLKIRREDVSKMTFKTRFGHNELLVIRLG